MKTGENKKVLKAKTSTVFLLFLLGMFFGVMSDSPLIDPAHASTASSSVLPQNMNLGMDDSPAFVVADVLLNKQPDTQGDKQPHKEAGKQPDKQAGKPEAEGGDFVQLWKSRFKEIDVIESEVNEITGRFSALQEASERTINKARGTADNLLSLYKVSRRLPSEQLVFLYQLQRLETSVIQALDPLKEIAEALGQELGTIETQQDNIAEIFQNTLLIEQASGDEKALLRETRQRLKQSSDSLKHTQKQLEKILLPAEKMATKLNSTVQQIRDDMPSVWTNYYKTRAGINLTSMIQSSSASTWLTSLSSRLIFTVPQTMTEWYGVGKSFAIATLIYLCFAVVVINIVEKIPLQQRQFLKKYGVSPLLWMGLGVGINAAAFDEQGTIYLSFLVGGALVLVWGVVTLGWRLRWAVNPALKSRVSPLAQMFPVAALGIFLLQSDAPPTLLCFIWFMVMLLFSAFIYSITWRHIRGQETQPFLEQFVYINSFVVSVLSLAVTIVGYTRLAILAFIFLIAVANFIILGSSITCFVQGLIDRYIDREEHPVKNSMVHVCNVPLSWLLAFCLSLPWVWAVPGSLFIFDHMMHTGYTFGDTSVNFGKIIVVGLLFILFRSLASLASSSLYLIGKRLSHVEEGAIPPLQNIVVYALWGLFGLISLAILGVSLTSIAVVAGGLSVGIGFGLQNIFNNFISGIVLIFGRTVLVGDYIEVDGIVGTVRAISIRSTSIETSEMALVYVPNSLIMSGKVTNWTRNTRNVRRTVAITIPVGNSFENVATLLRQVAEEQKHVVAFIEPTVQLVHLGMKTMTVNLTVVVDDLSHASSTMSKIREAIHRSFLDQGIEIK